ncbi:LysR family transcriptional regulator [Bradyrhizobium sp. 187]|nr:LysR family transcriptional regulator [Bradyrhizobium sp. 187]
MKLFVAAYEERSFTTAAEREHATQSGVSQHIRKLEDSFRVKLFVRDTGGVVPTPAGDQYYHHCIEVLRAHATAERAVRSFGHGIEGAINIGLMPTMTRGVLAPTLARFINEHPNCAIRVVEGFSAALTLQVQNCVLDFAIVPAFPGALGLRSRLFIRTPEVLVSAKHSDLKHGQPIDLRDISPIKLVLPSKVNTRRNLIETYLSSNSIQIDKLLELDAMLGSLDFVARTDWHCILPGIMMAETGKPRSFTVNPIANPPFGLDLILIEPSRRVLSAPATAFLEILSEEAHQLNQRWPRA